MPVDAGVWPNAKPVPEAAVFAGCPNVMPNPVAAGVLVAGVVPKPTPGVAVPNVGVVVVVVVPNPVKLNPVGFAGAPKAKLDIPI